MNYQSGSLQDQIAFTKTLLDTHLERKGRGRVRRVRTPEGSRKYGLPIGAVITLDAIQKLKRHKKKRDSQVLGTVENVPDVNATTKKGDNNDNVAWRVIRQDRDLKGVDLKSGKYTNELLSGDRTYKRETFPDGRLFDDNGNRPSPSESIVRLTGLDVIGYRTQKDDPDKREFRMAATSANVDFAQDPTRALREATGEYASEFDFRVGELTWHDAALGSNASIHVRPTNSPPRGKSGQKLKYTATVQYGRRRGGGWKQFLAETPEEAFEAASRSMVLLNKRLTEYSDDGYDEEGMWPVNRKPRDYDGVIETWPGIRGWDFALDDSDSEVDFNSKWQRRQLAEKDALEMGFEWATASTWLRNKGSDPDGVSTPVATEVMEIVNALMRSHEEQYPGMAQLFDQIGSVKADWATAWNGSGNRDTGLGHHTTNVMGMNYRWFAEGATKANGTVSDRFNPNTPVWHVNDGDDGIRKRLGQDLTDQQIVALQVMTHEIGHTVGYILQRRSFDAVGGKNSYMRFLTDPGTDKEDDTVANFHRERMLDILEEYGMFDAKKAEKFRNDKLNKLTEQYTADMESIQSSIDHYERMIKEYPDSADVYRKRMARDQQSLDDLKERIAISANEERFRREQESGWMFIGGKGFANDDPFNRQAIAEHLSEYAATNVSEIMAETWAAYQLQENPGDFVREMGELMETALQDYLAETDLTMFPKSPDVVKARRAAGLPTWDTRKQVGSFVNPFKGRDSPTTENMRKVIDNWEKSGQDGRKAERPSIMHIKPFIPTFSDGTRAPKDDQYVIESWDDSEESPSLIMRQVIMEPDGMFVKELGDELIQFNFDTNLWERI